MKPAVEWVSRPEPAQARLALQPAGELIAERDHLQRGGEHELTRVQHERLAVRHLDQRGQVVLLLGRVDVGVEVVVEDPEKPVQAHVDAGRLHQGGLEGLQRECARLDLGHEVAVGEQHPTTIATCWFGAPTGRAPVHQVLPGGAAPAGVSDCRLVQLFDRMSHGFLVRIRRRRAPTRRRDPALMQQYGPGLRLSGHGPRRRRAAGAPGVAGDHRRRALLLHHRLAEAPRPRTRRPLRAALVPARGERRRGVRGRPRPAGDRPGAGRPAGPRPPGRAAR